MYMDTIHIKNVKLSSPVHATKVYGEVDIHLREFLTSATESRQCSYSCLNTFSIIEAICHQQPLFVGNNTLQL